MKGYVANTLEAALANEYFRQVLYTDERLQLVVMALKPGEDIGAETHQLNQFLYVAQGSGSAVLGGESMPITVGSGISIPAGVEHNIKNGDTGAMKLITIYTPPNHAPGTVHKTKADAQASEEHH
jgi:mannose-6-phosphate isomerase-like protein (cupin superfamily)